MIIDYDLLLSEKQAVAATANSNIIKLGKGNKLYNPLKLVVTLVEGLTSGEVTKVAIQTATDAAFTTPKPLTEITLNIPAAKQTKPCMLLTISMPMDTEEYVRLVYTASAPVGGKITAMLVAHSLLR